MAWANILWYVNSALIWPLLLPFTMTRQSFLTCGREAQDHDRKLTHGYLPKKSLRRQIVLFGGGGIRKLNRLTPKHTNNIVSLNLVPPTLSRTAQYAGVVLGKRVPNSFSGPG